MCICWDKIHVLDILNVLALCQQSDPWKVCLKKTSPGTRFSKDPISYRARKAISNDWYLKESKFVGIKLCMEVNFVWKEQLCKHTV